jgi:hypothetical protein
MRLRFVRWVEGFRLQLAISLQQDFYLALGLFQFLAAGTRELHAFVEKLQCPIERDISLFQFRNDDFQPLETFLEFGQTLDSLNDILVRILADTSSTLHEIHLPIRSSTDAVMIKMPVRMVGSGKGTKSDECSDGSCLPVALLSATLSGATAPNRNMAVGIW